MREAHPKTKQPVSRRRATGITVAVIIGVLILGFAAWAVTSKKDVNSFKECVAVGGAIMESYPERCTMNGKTFTNEAQSMEVNGEAYVGLSEEAALSRAAEAGKAARIVRRDSQDLPVTMDFSPGRLNLYVQNDRVYMVQVEGE